MEKNDILESKIFRGIILGIAGLIILAFVFGLGIFVGTKKADFSFKWADEYHRNFGGPQGGLFGDFNNNEFSSANGVYGQIIGINPSTGSGQAVTLTIKGRDNVEKIATVDDKTTIRIQMQNEKISDLKVGNNIVVIGEPSSNGQIEAEFIRILPAPPAPGPMHAVPQNTNSSSSSSNINQ